VYTKYIYKQFNFQVWIKGLWLCSWWQRVKCFSWVKADNTIMWW